jgi:adenylosuccinate synthase
MSEREACKAKDMSEREAYKAKDIDTEKFIEQLYKMREFQLQKKSYKISEAEAYFQGYYQAIADVKMMFNCSNYEKAEVTYEKL